MDSHFALSNPSPQAPGRLSRRAAAPAALLALLLGACASKPLPPWNPPAVATVSVPAPQTAEPAPATPVAELAPASTGPVAPPTTPQTPAPSSSSVAAPGAAPDQAPYGPAVAARFPDPAIVYSTPGLQPGSTRFTSNAEMSSWLHDLAAANGTGGRPRTAVVPLGLSQSGVPMEALVLTRGAATDAAGLLASGKPTVLLAGQQHGDEPAAAEALLVVARELARGVLEPLLDRINVIVVPRANPDGAAADQHATAGGIDMNRDHLLLRTPEARALAKLHREYQPVVAVDAHEYVVAGGFLQGSGAVQKFDVLLQYATTPNLSEFLPRASEEWFRRPLGAALRAQNITSEWYYVPASGAEVARVSTGGTTPEVGRNVDGLRNVVSLWIATRGVGIGRMHIQRRVHTQVAAIASVLQTTAQRADDLGKLRPYMDREAASQACRGEVVLQSAPSRARRNLLALDAVTGADKSVEVEWESALELRAVKTRARPCGYWLSAGSGAVVERLQLLGVQVTRIAEPGALLGEVYRETSRTSAAREGSGGTPVDADPAVKVEVTLVRGVLDVPLGSYYVPLDQPLAHLAVAALEPDAPGSFFSHGLQQQLAEQARVVAAPTVQVERLERQP